jgi:hypothetical protein
MPTFLHQGVIVKTHRRHWQPGLLGLAMLVLLGAWLSAPVPALLVEEAATGRTLARLPLGDGPVLLRYRHSLYDAPAEEEFAVEGDELVLRRVRSPSLAVLEYYARPEPPRAVDGGYAIDGLNDRHRALPVLAGPIGARTLAHGGRAITLHELAAAGGQVHVRVGQAPRIASVKGW